MEFKDVLYKLRKEKKMSQQDIGNLIGISSQAVSKWETGISEPDNKSLKKLANFFNVSIDYLLNNTEINDNELKEQEALRKALVNAGFMEDIEDLTDGELNKIMRFVVHNKDFLIDGK